MTSADARFGLVYYRPDGGRPRRHAAGSPADLAIAALGYLRDGWHVRLSAAAVEWFTEHPAGPPFRSPEGAASPRPSSPVSPAPPAVFR